MNLNVIKVLVLCLLLSSSLALNAQEEVGCDLPAPQSLTLTLQAPDVVDAIWSPVAGAFGYEVLLVDLSTNQVLYNNTHFGTSATISGYTITNDMIVAVAALCDNNEPGTHIIGDVTEGIHLEELVLQTSGPNGPTVIHTCLPNQTVNAYTPDTVTIQVTTPTNTASTGKSRFTKTFVELSGAPGIIYNNQSAYSLVELSVNPNGGPLNVSFPHQLSSSSAAKNTTQQSLTSNLVDVLFGNPAVKFYSLDHNDTQAVNAAYFHIASVHRDQIQVTTRNCFEGKLSSANEGPAGLMADNTNNRDLTQNALKTKTPNFTVGPNPVTDRLNVTFQEKGTVTIMDMTGQIWFQQEDDSPTLGINVTHWPAGTYLLRQDTSFGPFVRLFIKL